MSFIQNLLPFSIQRGTAQTILGGANSHGGNDFQGILKAGTTSTEFEARTLEVDGDKVVLCTFKDTDHSSDTRVSFRSSQPDSKDGFVCVENGGGLASLIQLDISVPDVAEAEKAYQSASPSGPLTQFTFGQSEQHGYEFQFGG